jgi:hypothetical protein
MEEVSRRHGGKKRATMAIPASGCSLTEAYIRGYGRKGLEASAEGGSDWGSRKSEQEINLKWT